MMTRWRLRTKFLLWMLVISASVTAITLLLVRRVVESHLRSQIRRELRNSVSTFNNVQRQRQFELQHVAQLVGNLPISRALMTTNHPATIQDGIGDLWRLAGTDLLVMADRSGNVLGLRSHTAGLSRAELSDALRQTHAGTASWWFVGGHLYEISVDPIYLGAPVEERIMGFLAAGSNIDQRVAHDLGDVAGIEVGFCYGDRLIHSTLAPRPAAALATAIAEGRITDEPLEMQLGREGFLISSVNLEGESARPVRLVVLKSLTEANDFVRRLDILLLGIGLVALLASGLVVSVVARAFTRPLDRLVDGVRALGRGDYDYPLPSEGHDEIAELTSAFARMRAGLQETQRELLHSERLATIGRMASSISHDLRHHLVAILANAEFLMDQRSPSERQELYEELKAGVAQMTDMIESLLELSRPREALHPAKISLNELVQRVAHAIRAYAQFCTVRIEVRGDQIEGYFDPNKLQRVIQNLLVNACEAVPGLGEGRVVVSLLRRDDIAEIRIADNGHGVLEELKPRIFDAFVSYGKENGTGLGLTVVRKLVQDHGGTTTVESTGVNGTVMLIRLPLVAPEGSDGAAHEHTVLQPPSGPPLHQDTETPSEKFGR